MKKTIWTNGCFDIIHKGHIELFRYAKSLGDKLIVGIDTDRRIKERKGTDRPINNQIDRHEKLLNIPEIDNVFIFDSNLELTTLIKSLNVETIVVGDDYKDKQIVGSECVKNIILFPKIIGYSTTDIINRNRLS